MDVAKAGRQRGDRTGAVPGTHDANRLMGIEHAAANRAPFTESPLVGTGMEAVVARDSGYVVPSAKVWWKASMTRIVFEPMPRRGASAMIQVSTSMK